MNRRPGYSLIELLAVLTIISIVAVSVTFRWSGSTKRVIFQDAIQQLIHFEEQARKHAVRARKAASFEVDLNSNSLRAIRWSSGQSYLKRVSLNSAVQIKGIWIAGRRQTEGLASISVSADGRAPSWAVELESGNQNKFIMFLGRTGQPLQFDDPKEIEAIFDELRLSGADTD